jgi:3-oxoacyl-[acyl-carrier-protein] synthase-1
MRSDPADIVVTGLGMRTSLGNDTAQTAAAVRAGVCRFAAWPHAGIGPEEGVIVAAPLCPDLGDLPWIEKAIDMAPQPLHEALWQAGLYEGAELRAAGGGPIAAYVATPRLERAGVAPEAMQIFLEDLKVHCIAPLQADALEVIPCDQPAAILATARAIQALQGGAAGIAVVSAIDSYLHAPWLEDLLDARRLKCETTATGLIPGEAVAFAILERRAHAEARGARPLARIASVAVDRETVPLGPEHPIRAEGLSRAVKAALAPVGGGAEIHRVIVDLNGERWRFIEWALAEGRCLHTLPRGWQTWHPADCLGDVGAAFGVVALGIAQRAFARGYAGGGGFLLAGAALAGERAALTVFPDTGQGR